MPDAPTEELWADPAWLDALIEAVARWLDGEPVVVGVDSTRQLFAWSTDASVDGWIGECVDFTVQAIAPDPYRLAANHCSDAATNATLALIAAVRALEADGHADPIAAIRAVLPARISPQ